VYQAPPVSFLVPRLEEDAAYPITRFIRPRHKIPDWMFRA